MVNPDVALGLKGFSTLSPPGATFALYYTWGFTPKAQRETQKSPIGRKMGQGRKYLSVPSLGSQDSHRAGQQHVCIMGLEYWVRIGLKLVGDQPLGACHESAVCTVCQ